MLQWSQQRTCRSTDCVGGCMDRHVLQWSQQTACRFTDCVGGCMDRHVLQWSQQTACRFTDCVCGYNHLNDKWFVSDHNPLWIYFRSVSAIFITWIHGNLSFQLKHYNFTTIHDPSVLQFRFQLVLLKAYIKLHIW